MEIKEGLKILYKKVGKNIKETREKRGITILDLSIKTGIRKEYLKKIENGEALKASISMHFYAISKALDTTMYKIFDV